MKKKQNEVIMRTTKVKVGKEWHVVTVSDLKVGDKFRMWEPDGTIIRVNNKYVFTVAGAPMEVTNEDGVATWGVTCE